MTNYVQLGSVAFKKFELLKLNGYVLVDCNETHWIVEKVIGDKVSTGTIDEWGRVCWLPQRHADMEGIDIVHNLDRPSEPSTDATSE